jgi:hypothetical protein
MTDKHELLAGDNVKKFTPKGDLQAYSGCRIIVIGILLSLIC